MSRRALDPPKLPYAKHSKSGDKDDDGVCDQYGNLGPWVHIYGNVCGGEIPGTCGIGAIEADSGGAVSPVAGGMRVEYVQGDAVEDPGEGGQGKEEEERRDEDDAQASASNVAHA